MKKTIEKHKKALIFLTIVLIFFIVSLSAAKYVDEEKNSMVYEANAFYFESDELSETENISYTYGTGENSINFKLKNYEDDFRESEVDIEYNVIITDLDENIIQEKNGKLMKGKKDENTITFDNLAKGTYKIIAKAISPYLKTLSGTVTIQSINDEINYQVNDSKDSSVLYVTILTNDYSGNIKILFPNELIPNNLDNSFSELTETSAIMEFKSNSEYNIQFFKKDSSKIYTKDEISAERSN